MNKFGAQPTSIRKAQALIVGGGLAGLVAAYAIAKTGLTSVHLAPAAPMDHRTSALMTPSISILQDLGLVDNPNDLGVPLEKIRIIDATSRLLRAPETVFDSKEAKVDAFGWNFANAGLSKHFSPLIKNQKNLTQVQQSATKMTRTDEIWQVELSDGSAVQAPLVIGADGKGSFVRTSVGIDVRQHQHRQSALVCDLTLGLSLNGESVEYHYENGPFTLVPSQDMKANLVWIEDAKTLEQIKKLPNDEILQILQKKSQNLFGKLSLNTGVFVFPLSSHAANKMGREGVVLVGESGHAFPPIGAQGLNLSLRDIKDLLTCLEKNSYDASDWANTISNEYAIMRAPDIRRTNTMVDGLFRSLLSDLLPAQMMRAGGIWALKSIPPLRKHAFQMGMGHT